MRTALTYTAATAVAIAALWGAWVSLKPTAAPLGVDMKTLISDAYWQERIQAVGPEKADEELERLAEDLNRVVWHQMTHAFGGALYRELGISGFSFCDTRFFSGCPHEFMGLAIDEHGEGIVSELYDECLKHLNRYTSCLH